MQPRMSAFEIYVRTGRRVPDQPELVETKFNPWHDPDDGRFTFAGSGRHFGSGHVGSGKETASRRRVSDTGFLIALADVNFQLGADWYKEHKKTWSLMLDGDYEAAAREAQDSDWYDQTPKRVQAFQRALLDLRRKPIK